MFIDIAQKGKNEFELYIVGIVLIITAFFVGQIPYGATIAVFNHINPEKAEQLQNAMRQVQQNGINNNLIFFFNLIPFVFGVFFLFAAVRYLHNRRVKSVITEAPRFRFSRFWFAAAIWLLLNIVSELSLYFFFPENYSINFQPEHFYPLLLIALLLIPFQASFEELFIRGYLLQAFMLWFKRPCLAIVTTALVFASLHLPNPEIKEYGLIVLSYYFIFGLLAAIIAHLDNGLEIPMAIHIMNNFYGAVLVSYKDSVFSTPALFSVKRIDLPVLMLISTLMVVVFFVIVKLRYKWKLKQ